MSISTATSSCRPSFPTGLADALTPLLSGHQGFPAARTSR